MHWVEFEGTQLPKRVGGHPALDFCNTWAGWGEPPEPQREWLKSYGDLATWAHYADLITAEDSRRLHVAATGNPREAARTLADARRLRTAVHDAALDLDDTHAVAGVTRYARRAASVARLRTSEGVPARWEIPASVGLDLAVLLVAQAAGELLTSPDVLRVAACPGRDCGWLFIDRRGRRRWCSMESCGNRSKVAAHATRHRQALGDSVIGPA